MDICTHRVRHPNLYTSGSAEGNVDLGFEICVLEDKHM